MSNHLINPALIGMTAMKLAAARKQAFIPSGDPSMGGAPPPDAGGGMPPGGDPAAAAGGAPPPAAPPPAPPPQPMPPMQQQQQAVEPIKPKIDQNVVSMQILKMLARIADALKIPIPASEMVVNQTDLTQWGMQQQQGGGAQPGVGGGQQSAIPPIDPMQAAAPGMGGGGGKTAAALGYEVDSDGIPYGYEHHLFGNGGLNLLKLGMIRYEAAPAAVEAPAAEAPKHFNNGTPFDGRGEVFDLSGGLRGNSSKAAAALQFRRAAAARKAS